MTTLDLKAINYDYVTRDYAYSYDGQLIGFASTHHAAEVALDAYCYDLLIDGATATATELDGEGVNWSLDDIPTEPPPDDAPGSDDEDGTPQALDYNKFLASVDTLLDCAGFVGAHQDIDFDWQMAYTCQLTPSEAIFLAMQKLTHLRSE